MATTFHTGKVQSFAATGKMGVEEYEVTQISMIHKRKDSMSNDRLPPCNPDVYAHGEIIAIVDMPKAEAEAYCKEQTAKTGHQYDWHYAGGRVVVRCLTKEKVAELLVEHNRKIEVESLKELNAELLAALRPFANCTMQIDKEEDDEEWAKFRLLVKDYRRASAAVAKTIVFNVGMGEG